MFSTQLLLLSLMGAISATLVGRGSTPRSASLASHVAGLTLVSGYLLWGLWLVVDKSPERAVEEAAIL